MLFYAKISNAAAVFEEAASHKPRSWHTWNQRSALTPKAPAPPDVSPPDAQTHRPSNQKMSSTCPMSERTSLKIGVKGGGGDAIFEIFYKPLKLGIICPANVMHKQGKTFKAQPRFVSNPVSNPVITRPVLMIQK
ncbi:hypothetical protein GCM10011309_25980 [Litorimonas cladophorae]|uniref:Uncharacterized protein n=1 Tax=Litorimonas cladophorae TaxID=1220491 RepID=A0A918KSQ6_9PROT|nr:hypothetical protein GCM10011309_25980 [Litorimonas cladophorae]